MKFTRRGFIKGVFGAAAVAVLPVKAVAEKVGGVADPAGVKVKVEGASSKFNDFFLRSLMEKHEARLLRRAIGNLTGGFLVPDEYRRGLLGQVKIGDTIYPVVNSEQGWPNVTEVMKWNGVGWRDPDGWVAEVSPGGHQSVQLSADRSVVLDYNTRTFTPFVRNPDYDG